MFRIYHLRRGARDQENYGGERKQGGKTHAMY